MARPLRAEFDGAIYHFDDDEDHKAFLESLGKVVNCFNWLCHSYTLIDNHYHPVIETPGHVALFPEPWMNRTSRVA